MERNYFKEWATHLVELGTDFIANKDGCEELHSRFMGEREKNPLVAALFSLVTTTNRRPSYSHCHRASFFHRIASKHMGLAKLIFFSEITDSQKNIFFKNSKIKIPTTTQDNRSQINYLMIKNLKTPGSKFISQFLDSLDDFSFAGLIFPKHQKHKETH